MRSPSEVVSVSGANGMPREAGFSSSPLYGKKTSFDSSAPTSALSTSAPATTRRSRLFRRERLRIFDVVGDHPRELSALQQFTPLAAAPGDLVLGGADRLLAAAAR